MEMSYKIVQVLAIILAVMSLLLLIVSPVAGIIGILLAALLFFVSRKNLKKEKADQEARAQASLQRQQAFNEKLKAVSEMKVPTGKYSKTMTVKVAGVTHKCRNDETTNRQEVLERMDAGDVVLIQPYKFSGRTAYLVVDPLSGDDLGNLPEDVAEAYPDAKIEGCIAEVGSFTLEDKDEDIYFARVKIYIMEEA